MITDQTSATIPRCEMNVTIAKEAMTETLLTVVFIEALQGPQ